MIKLAMWINPCKNRMGKISNFHTGIRLHFPPLSILGNSILVFKNEFREGIYIPLRGSSAS